NNPAFSACQKGQVFFFCGSRDFVRVIVPASRPRVFHGYLQPVHLPKLLGRPRPRKRLPAAHGAFESRVVEHNLHSVQAHSAPSFWGDTLLSVPANRSFWRAIASAVTL